MILPFDAHNHVHMGPTPPFQALMAAPDAVATTNNKKDEAVAAVSGMAIMSTHPRDFENVLELTKNLPKVVNGNVHIVPCLGVHPWFLHELTEEDWQLVDCAGTDGTSNSDNDTTVTDQPKWIQELEKIILANPNAIVGEIGLDGFHFDPETEELVSPMNHQVDAFRMQMELAAKLNRPVSIHTVQCFGPLYETLNEIKKNAKQKNAGGNTKNKQKTKPSDGLPPKMYFHAFGGKVGTIDQILSLCGKEPNKVYFGFAPIINFRSSKTADVIRKVGIERLVLESDHEDASRVPESIEKCIEYLASALDMREEDVIERTTANAFDLYNLN